MDQQEGALSSLVEEKSFWNQEEGAPNSLVEKKEEFPKPPRDTGSDS